MSRDANPGPHTDPRDDPDRASSWSGSNRLAFGLSDESRPGRAAMKAAPNRIVHENRILHLATIPRSYEMQF